MIIEIRCNNCAKNLTKMRIEDNAEMSMHIILSWENYCERCCESILERCVVEFQQENEIRNNLKRLRRVK